ncbi:MAG: hypothetical protein ACM3H8_01600 [Sphingobacteriales bacterium]
MKNKFIELLMIFLKTTYDCYSKTNYAEDRIAFQSDIVLCVSWLIKAHDNISINEIIEDVFDLSSSKHIFDYYKQGIYGDIQAKAFVEFKKELELIR